MYLLIDNYDSFTYNLVQAFTLEGVYPLVKRNDEISIDEVAELDPDKIIISPGPKTPSESGISKDIINAFGKEKLILGICLGHQCIAEAFGGAIQRVENIVHGATSNVSHNGKGIFKGLPDPFKAARYHSLEARDIPDSLAVTARTASGLIMGIEHKELPIIGLQFHPESFMTEHGQKIISNFVEM